MFESSSSEYSSASRFRNAIELSTVVQRAAIVSVHAAQLAMWISEDQVGCLTHRRRKAAHLLAEVAIDATRERRV